MKPVVLEWIEKAEGDFRSARRELRVRDHPNYDLICFLSQQCAEKYLKGLLTEAGIEFSKIYDLEELLDSLLPVAPHLERFRASLASLTDHAVDFRYPGESATREVARTAFANCQSVRRAIRKILGVDEPPSAQLRLRVSEKRARYRTKARKR
ncbi:MAG TPA: HEPN domain-containing protein [Verrucomicrobiae bacterium]|nr:HEPN domain-containing protein [Verrucomicrobiae bacterium]